jgi:hypothetical protein
MKHNFMSGKLYKDSSDFSSLVTQTASKIILLVSRQERMTHPADTFNLRLILNSGRAQLYLFIMILWACLHRCTWRAIIPGHIFWQESSSFLQENSKPQKKILESSLQISRWLTHSSYHNIDHLTFSMQVDEDLSNLVLPHFFAGCLLSSCPTVQIRDDATLNFFLPSYFRYI